jgi:DNA-binding transcriptional regulator YiaG
MTSQRIKEIRKLFKVTQKSFADLIMVNYETYCSWEEGRRYCSSPGYAILSIAENYPDIFLKNRNKLIQKINHKMG